MNRSKVTVGILTVSDRCFEGVAVDRSGENLKKLVSSNLIPNRISEVIETRCVPDVEQIIVEALTEWTDGKLLNLILTTGGTGFSPRDVTPEAVKKVIEREAASVCTMMTASHMLRKPVSALSRSVCGIRKRTIIVTLPGNVTGSEECFRCIAPIMGHAVDVLNCRKESVDEMHQKEHSAIIRESQTPITRAPQSKADISKVALRNRKSPYPLVTVEQAQQMVFKLAAAFNPDKITLHISKAHGFVIAEDITSSVCVPPFRASTKDGYAVRSVDGLENRRVLGGVSAGDRLNPISDLKKFPCMRINTGAPVPDWADSVVQVEDTLLVSASEDHLVEHEIKILSVPQPQQDIRPLGIDINKGDVVLRRCTHLTAAEIGVLASLGAVQVEVYSKPKVALLSTGNELQAVDHGRLKPNKIYDSNIPVLSALLESHNIPFIDGGICQDEPQMLLIALKKLLDQGVDVLVTTGSVSMGDKDMLREVLIADFDATIHFARVFMKPGKPTTFASFSYGGRTILALGLPGNPVSATVTANLYLLPLCRKMARRMDYQNKTMKVQLTHCFPLSERPEYHRVTLALHSDKILPQACSTGSQLSSRLMSCVLSHALVILPPQEDLVTMKDEGDMVDAIVIN